MVQETWSVRRATFEDRDAIRDLCVSTVGQDDYVVYMLDDLIGRAKTLIALDKGKVIGVMAYRRQMDGSAWLSSARTLPDYQGRGVAASIIRSCEVLAREDGVSALRLWTESDNESGKAAFIKAGFKEVGRFTRMTAPPAAAGLGDDFGLIGYSESLWVRVQSSEVLCKSHSYLNHGFGFLKITRELFKTLIDNGFVHGWGRNVAVMSESMFNGVETLEAQVLLGNPREALMDLPAIAKSTNMEQVHTFLPHDAGMISAAREAGFGLIDWGMEAILCEKGISRTNKTMS